MLIVGEFTVGRDVTVSRDVMVYIVVTVREKSLREKNHCMGTSPQEVIKSRMFELC